MNSEIYGRLDRRLALVALMAIACHAQAQTGSRQRKVSSVPELLDLGNDPKADVDYQQVARFLSSLAPAARQSVERRLIGLPHQELASAAAIHLIASRDGSAAEIIASRISGWEPRTQSSILVDIAPVREDFLMVPRAVLTNALLSKSHPVRTMPLDFVGSAAMLVAGTGDRADIRLIQDVALREPQSWGIWMAITKAQAINEPLIRNARTTYEDETVPMLVRTAAATALEMADPQASAFVIRQIQEFLNRFSDTDVAQMISDTYQEMDRNKTGRQMASPQFAALTNGLPVLSSLMVLKGDAARQLTLAGLNARNQNIRLLCAIVVARRWPTELLKLGQGQFSNQEYANLLAVVTDYNPDQAAAAAAGMKPETLEAARTHLQDVGLVVFGLPGMVLTFF